MSDDKKDSGFRGRIDRFFDKQAKEQQNLLQGKVGGTSIKDSWDEVKTKVSGKKASGAKPKAHKVKESKGSITKSNAKEVEISPLARSFIRVTTEYPPITIGIMTVITLFMLIGIGKMNINGAMEVYLPKGSVEEELLLEVREDYSTDIIVIYVETDNAYDVSNKANISGTVVGAQAGIGNGVGINLTLFGYRTGGNSYNSTTFIGHQAGRSATSACDFTTAVGSNSLYNNAGRGNVAIGNDSGQQLTSGEFNTLAGYKAGRGNLSGTINYTDAQTSNGKSSNGDTSSGQFINPLKKRRVKRALNIDSRFRDNYYNTVSTDYNVKLPLSFEKVVEMELMHMELPLSFYGITKEKGNHFFWVKLSIDGVLEYFQVELEDGNYASSTITTAIDNAMFDAYNEVTGDNNITFSTTINTYSNKLTISATSDTVVITYMDLNFSCGYYENANSSDYHVMRSEYYNTNGGESLQLKLGWVLGFRFSKYSSGTSFHETEALFENPIPRYLYLVVDDYNNNVNNCIYSAFNSSILNKNILAKIGYYGSYYDIYKTYKVDDGQHVRTYFGPVNIRKLSIKLIDEYGRQVDLNNMDFSFGLALTCLYD